MQGGLQQQRRHVRGTVDIKKLKVFAFEKFSKDCPLRDVLLAERDLLGVHEFLIKLDVWLKLLRRDRL